VRLLHARQDADCAGIACRRPATSRARISAGLEHNPCRCGAQLRILDAVQAAATAAGAVIAGAVFDAIAVPLYRLVTPARVLQALAGLPAVNTAHGK